MTPPVAVAIPSIDHYRFGRRTDMLRFAGLICVAVLVGGLAGCGAQGGKTIYTQGANAAPVMGTAPESGIYQLYTAMSPNPTTTVRLKEGDPLGFHKTDDGRMVGVAGTETIDLPKNTAQAYWKLKKE
jgi:hypothetical protein